MSLSGWAFAQAIASRSSSSACFTKGHRLGAMTTEIMVGVLELICRLPEIGHRRSDVRVALRVTLRHGGRVLAEPEHSGAKAVGAFAPAAVHVIAMKLLLQADTRKLR